MIKYLEFKDLKAGMKVYQEHNETCTCTVKSCRDIHNVEIVWHNGSGPFCFDLDCDEYEAPKFLKKD